MPKKPAKLRPDAAEIAFRVMQEATGELPKTKPPSERTTSERNVVAAKRGASGGRKGGRARSESLTPAQRKAIAKNAAAKRWNRNDNDQF